MILHEMVAQFVGGVFLANFFPHFVAGVSGRAFPSPFAKPPFRGLSSPTVNVLWSLFNLVAAYTLVVLVGHFEWAQVAHFAVSAAGFGLASVGIARSLERMRA